MNLLAVFCILSWRVFWLTMTNRVAPDAQPELVFTDMELRILDRLVADKPTARLRQHLLSHYLIKLARLGGYLARNADSPPGNETVWRGLTRLVDIQLGVMLGAQLVGMYGPPPCRKRKMKVTGGLRICIRHFMGSMIPGQDGMRRALFLFN